ncbi:MAG: cbb3-type cytochrome c oxidase subunit I [Magnetococcales bacterium]|nr:cbb3-type cytochrome c oxidase subunit I [Magnetococcales bacterium]
MPLPFASQAVARPYFLAALVLFGLQIVFGLILSVQYTVGDFLFPALPFNMARMIHSNLLIYWLLFGFMGSAYYIIPEESRRELHSVPLAMTLFWLLLAVCGLNILGYLLFTYSELASLTGNAWLPTMGREFLEQPTPFKIALVLVILGFLANITLTAWRGRRTAINALMILGLIGLMIFFLFAFYNPDNLVLDKFFWWWIFHLWVEGVWELIIAAMLAFMILKLTGLPRSTVNTWIYWIMTSTFVTGLIGTGHHYYWIGTPESWLWWGSIFSSLEPMPFFVMMIMAFNMRRRRVIDHENSMAMTWILGATVIAFIGTGVLGFLPTLAPINYYTHGSQMTPAHGHMAFYGAYAMFVLAMISYALPILTTGKPTFGKRSQTMERRGYLLMNAGIVILTVVLTAAGLVQIYLQRMGDDPQPFMEVQETLAPFYWIRLGAGILFAIGMVFYFNSYRNRPD